MGMIRRRSAAAKRARAPEDLPEPPSIARGCGDRRVTRTMPAMTHLPNRHADAPLGTGQAAI
jgi:hypothetical protein